MLVGTPSSFHRTVDAIPSRRYKSCFPRASGSTEPLARYPKILDAFTTYRFVSGFQFV